MKYLSGDGRYVEVPCDRCGKKHPIYVDRTEAEIYREAGQLDRLQKKLRENARYECEMKDGLGSLWGY